MTQRCSKTVEQRYRATITFQSAVDSRVILTLLCLYDSIKVDEELIKFGFVSDEAIEDPVTTL